MKKTMKFLEIFVLVLFVVTTLLSCDRDNNPDNDFFAGTYKGSISYKNGGTSKIIANEGSVSVTKIVRGKKYNFRFSNDIPDIEVVDFDQKGDRTIIMVGSNETSYIRIENNKELKISYIKDGKIWTANCTR